MSRRYNLLASLSNDSGGGNTFIFYLGNSECVAEEGMTFYDWIMSDYFDYVYFMGPPTISEYRNWISQWNYNENSELRGAAGAYYIPKVRLLDEIQPINYVYDNSGWM